MELQFWKMQGLGNDYVVIDDRREEVPEQHLAELAVRLCCPHFGIGADGLILVLDSLTEDIRMRIFNADGSEAQMCGNGIRCLSRYVFERNLVLKPEFRIETKAGLRKVFLELENGRIASVRVDMGRPEIQKFVGALAGHGGTRGVFITTSTFSGEARTYADQVPNSLVLIDGPELTSLMIDYGVGVSVERTVKIARLDSDYFEEG